MIAGSRFTKRSINCEGDSEHEEEAENTNTEQKNKYLPIEELSQENAQQTEREKDSDQFDHIQEEN